MISRRKKTIKERELRNEEEECKYAKLNEMVCFVSHAVNQNCSSTMFSCTGCWLAIWWGKYETGIGSFLI